jgi:ribosomal protein S19E (S16A)
MQRFFQGSGPVVHEMVVALEKAGLVSRQPRVARSIRLRVERTVLPDLRLAHEQPVRNSVQSH